jgi:hypothetical protein
MQTMNQNYLIDRVALIVHDLLYKFVANNGITIEDNVIQLMEEAYLFVGLEIFLSF